MTDVAPNRDAIDAVHIGKMSAAKTKHESDTGEFRAVYAQAERMGVNLPAAKKALALKKKDGKLDEYLKEVKDTLRYMRLFGVRPQPSQVDFLDQDPSLIPIEEKAYSEGRHAALMNDGSVPNPHDENSKVGKRWAAGWAQGRQERELVMAMAMDDEDEDEEDGDGEFDEGDDPFVPQQAAE